MSRVALALTALLLAVGSAPVLAMPDAVPSASPLDPPTAPASESPAPASPAATGLTPAAILAAQETLAYRGELLINARQRVRVLHGPHNRQRQEFLGPGGHVTDTLVSDGQVRWHFSPSSKSVKLLPMDPPASLAWRLKLIRQNYRFEVMGQTRQAGRIVLLTQFVPLHPGNLKHRLWVDLDTRLPLVMERRAADGRLVDRSEYTQIAYQPKLLAGDFSFRIPEGCQVTSPLTVLARGEGSVPPPRDLPFHPEAPRELPPGYQLQSWQLFTGKQQVETFAWRFHDGLSLISLFATAARQGAKPPPDARSVKVDGTWVSVADHGDEHMLIWRTHGFAYNLVGHLPEGALLEVAKSTL